MWPAVVSRKVGSLTKAARPRHAYAAVPFFPWEAERDLMKVTSFTASSRTLVSGASFLQAWKLHGVPALLRAVSSLLLTALHPRLFRTLGAYAPAAGRVNRALG